MRQIKSFFSRCRVCNNLDTGFARSEHTLRIERDELEPNCKFCQLLESILADILPRDLPNVRLRPETNVNKALLLMKSKKAILAWASFDTIECTDLEKNAISEYLGKDVNRPGGGDIAFTVFLERPCPLLPGIPVAPPCAIETSLESSVAFAKLQINKCLHSHSNCIKLAGDRPPLPTRVLSIGTSETGPIRLIQPVDVRGTYATLSHCWGPGTLPMRTLQANLHAMLAGIEPAELPIVFLQAIQVARALSIEFIWIDSLCIVQDDAADWERQSARMCEYYENAFINISTASSPDHGTPVLGPRPLSWQPRRHRLFSSGGKSYEVLSKRITSLWSDDGGGRLFTRGWTWQESALAARTLYFTAQQVIWECRTDVVYEDGLLSWDEEARRLKLSYDVSRLKLFADKAASSGKPDSGLRRWNPFDSSDEVDEEEVEKAVVYVWMKMVEQYSSRQLTRDTDKLPAISGGAKMIQSISKDEYCAGLWRRHLVRMLCWRRPEMVAKFDRNKSSPKDYSAPSWSWASISQEVEFTDKDNFTWEDDVTVVGVDCEVPGLNPLGLVGTCRLTLRGKMVKAILDSENIRPVGTSPVPDEVKGWSFGEDCVLRNVDGGPVRAAHGDDEWHCVEAEAWCLLLGRFLYGECSFALVLGNPSADGKEFRRVGIMWSFNHRASSSFFDGAEERTITIV